MAGLDAAGLSLGSAMIALAETCGASAPDSPGFGDSDPLPAGWCFAECSAFLGPLLDALGLTRASLAGLSIEPRTSNRAPSWDQAALP